MKMTLPLALSCILLSCLLVCCKKDQTTSTGGGTHGDSTTTPHNDTPTVHMTLSYALKQSTITGGNRTNYELIVSEAGGRILLDTITDYNKTIVAGLKTTQTLLDVSAVYPTYYAPGQIQYWALTYKSVNLASWVNFPGSDSITGQPAPVVTGTGNILYTNLPLSPGFFYQFMSNTDASPAGSPEGTNNSNQLLITYPYEKDPYAYVVFPSYALYKLHKIQSTSDTVDASRLDTGRYLSFNWAADRDLNVVMYGYTDSTDLTHPLLLAPGHGDYQHGSGWEAIFPGKKYFQKFDLVLKGYNTTGVATVRESYLDTIPLDVPYLDASYFTVNSKTKNNFNIGFTKTKPTFYSFSGSFGAGGHGFILTAPADSALNPQQTLTTLTKGKFLSAQDPNTLWVNGFTFTLDANPDYQSYMTNAANAVKANTRPLSNQRSMSFGM